MDGQAGSSEVDGDRDVRESSLIGWPCSRPLPQAVLVVNFALYDGEPRCPLFSLAELQN